MAKFVLIDQSIKGQGGHYLEYATHVLEAAKQLGFEVCIATNKKFNGNIDYNCLPVYQYDIWGDSNLKLAAKKLKKSAGIILTPLKNIFSFFKREVKTLIRPAKKLGGKWKRKIKGNLSRYIAVIYFSDYGYWIETIRDGKFVLAFSVINPFKAVGFSLASFVIFLLSIPVKVVLMIIKILQQTIRILKKSVTQGSLGIHKFCWKMSFYNCTRRTVSYFKISKGDIVFIPTLSNIDLMAVKKFIKKKKAAQEYSWNLVFRRNLFVGREPDYKNYQKDKDELRDITYECAIKSEYRNINFFTDTEKLTEQYALMNTVNFYTLPIPVNPELEEAAKKAPEKPVNIIYLGDARREKGYQELPQIVDALWDQYVEEEKISFEFQSNFSFTNMDANCDIVAARDYMEKLPNRFMKLYKEPLSSQDYLKLAKSGDIALLFYDRDNYYARSSGALVECMIAGIPVIVPSGSWLSEQICQDNYKHLQGIKEETYRLKSFDGKALNWKNMSEDVTVNPMQHGFLSFGDKNNAALTVIENTLKANIIFVEYFVNGILQKGNYVKTQIIIKMQNEEKIFFESDDYSTKENGEKVIIACKLPKEAQYITVCFSNAFGLGTIPIYDIKITLSSSERDCVLGKYGNVFARYEDVPVLLSNMIDNYTVYESAAKEKAVQYRKKHNAQKLVRDIAKKAGVAICH